MAEPIKIKKIQTNEGNYHDIDAKCWDGYSTSDLVTIDGRSILSGEDISTMININYNDLVELRNSGNLIAGQKYRIIDYVTTTSEENTESAGHKFDIIVEALSETELSEIAYAIWNADDEYFDSENLNAWQLWYTIDNDKKRFGWVDSKSFIDSSDCTISVGYTMDSEEGLYKFDERIKFISNMWNDPNAEPYLEGSAIDELITHWGYETEPNGLESLTLYGLNMEIDEETGEITSEDGISSDRWYYRGIITVDDEDYDYWQKVEEDDEIDYNIGDGRQLFFLTNRIVSGSTTVVEEEGKGVIYRMIDEYGNDCPYDFKNIKFYNETHDKYVYTFSWIESDGTVIDTSIFGNKTLKDDVGEISGVYGNIIRPYCCGSHSLQQRLNNIVFISDREYDGGLYYGCYSNTFGYNCYNHTFGNDCSANTFGNDCKNNTFGDCCSTNTFGNDCYKNTFGNNCHKNTYGNNCSNTFGNDCSANTFGNTCYSNTFGNGCEHNTFCNTCYSNIFDDGCDYNTFAHNCSSNTLGVGCSTNTFGYRCYSNTLRGSDYYNTLGVGCYDNTLGYECNTNTFGNYCNTNTFGDYCNTNTFGYRCNKNTFGDYCHTNTFGISCHDNTFAIRCSTNTFGDYCSTNTFGNECENNTFGFNCHNNTLGYNCYSNTFGNNCKYNSFRIDASIDSDLLEYCKNIYISDGCSYNLIYHRGQQTTYDTQLQNINIIRGVSGKNDAYNFIPINNLGVEYEIKVAKNTAGEIKIYCEADLIA